MGLRREPAFILFGNGIDRFSWRGVKWFLLTYFGAFLAAGVLAPVIYQWIQSLPTPADPDALVSYLQSKPVSKYVDRVRLLFAAAALVWMIGACSLWGRFGFYWRQSGFRQLTWFVVGGVISLGLVVGLQSIFLPLIAKESATVGNILEVSLAALVGGLLIGWLEEAIFRGMVLRMFYTAVRPGTAILLSALLFAAVHFKSVPNGVGEPFHWYSGVHVAAYQSISVFLTVEAVDFINLFLAGVVLNLVFLRTGSLVGCMGLHAGWVLVRNTWSQLMEAPDGPATLFWGSERIVDGYASLILLLIIAIGLYVDLTKHQQLGKADLGPVT